MYSFIVHILSKKTVEICDQNPYKFLAESGVGEGDFAILGHCHNRAAAVVKANEFREEFGYIDQVEPLTDEEKEKLKRAAASKKRYEKLKNGKGTESLLP